MSKCFMCNDPLEGEEIDSPFIDEDGNPICDNCWDEYYRIFCHLCENSIDKKSPSSVVDGGSTASNFIGIVEGVSSEPDKVPAAQKGLCYSLRNVVLDFVKVLPIRKCGKVAEEMHINLPIPLLKRNFTSNLQVWSN